MHRALATLGLAWRAPILIGLATLALQAGAANADTAPAYQAITPTMADKTIVLTGHELTIDQVVQVARYGARVQLSAEAKQREANNYGLLLEAATEGVAVYWFNRG